MNPRALAEVDVVTLEQQKKERIERLVWSHLLCAQPECPALASIPHPILKCSAGYRCCQGTGPAVDLLHVPCQGYDPDAKAAFQPKAKQKGRSSTASLVKRKKTVMDQEHRDKVRRSLEQRKKKQDMAKPPGARPSALDRFV